MKGRSVIIHSLEHAKAALSVAERLGVPVVLLSAPGAAAYVGAAVFREMADAAARFCPGARFTAVLDCGEDPGLALGALRHGIKGVSISVAPEVKGKIADIAAQSGGVVYESKTEALDLLEVDDGFEACMDWLKTDHAQNT